MEEYSVNSELRQVKSCGVFVMKSDRSFLLMKQNNRYDLPKGHMELGETEQQTALRELMEETGIQSSDIDIDPNFRFEEIYYLVEERFGNERVKKTLVIFLGKLKTDSIQVITTEHDDFQWLNWNSPPIRIQTETVDPLLEKVHAHLGA